MRTLRRLAKDESGMTMALAVIMVVLLGVMGAGLLTFVMSDLNSVVEQNRGQRAFGVADAGIEAAKGQLAQNVDRGLYNDTSATVFVGTQDIQWSKAKGGLTLNNVDGEPTTPDSVNVTIQYRGSATDDFRVVSTGTYGSDPVGVAKRRIEAIFKGQSPNLDVTDDAGQPLYYTPSSIKITANDTSQGRVDLRDISLFAGKDILIQDENASAFIADMSSRNGGRLKSTGSGDALGNWNSWAYPLDQGRGPWNTQARNFTDPGLAAVGKICGWSSASTTPTGFEGSNSGVCTSTSASIADGVFAYDCTTGPVDLPDNVCLSPPNSRGNGLTFVDKQPQDKDPNDLNTITFPFPRLTPIPKSFHDDAVAGAAANPRTGATVTCTTNPCNPDFKTIFQSISNPSLVFVDANSSTVNYTNTGNAQGVLVVWCGRLVQQSKFTGIILNLYGDGSSFQSSSCIGDTTKGTYQNAGVEFAGWNYAQGGNGQLAGIEIMPGSTVRKYPGATWSLLNDSQFQGPPPSSFGLEGWRELYQ